MPRLPFLRGACWLWILAVISLSSGRADAYAWMIKHGFSKCNSCHTDPAGGETLTPFGRFQSQHLLSMGGADLEEQNERSRFLFGAIGEPTDVSLGGSYGTCCSTRRVSPAYPPSGGSSRCSWMCTARAVSVSS